MDTARVEISSREKSLSGELRTVEIYDQIIRESPFIPGDAGLDLLPGDIPWANPELIQQGQDFIRRNYFSVTMAHLGALIYGFSFKRLTTVLLRTGGFGLGDPHASLLRHIQTGVHIDKWYSTNVLDEESKGYRDIQFVRKLHVGAMCKCMRTPLVLQDAGVPDKGGKLDLLAALKADLDASCDTRESEKETELFTYHPQLLFSQFDMLMTQYGFISIIFLFPKTLGIKDTKGIDGFLHLWAIFGKLLGIEDRFNLALNPNRALFLRLFHNVGIPSLKGMDTTILHLAQTYVDGTFGRMTKLISLKGLLYYGLTHNDQLPGFRGVNFQALLSVPDRILLKVMHLCFFLLLNFHTVRIIMNKFSIKFNHYVEKKFLAPKMYRG